jgi:hypothetical protein
LAKALRLIGWSLCLAERPRDENGRGDQR